MSDNQGGNPYRSGLSNTARRQERRRAAAQQAETLQLQRRSPQNRRGESSGDATCDATINAPAGRGSCINRWTHRQILTHIFSCDYFCVARVVVLQLLCSNWIISAHFSISWMSTSQFISMSHFMTHTLDDISTLWRSFQLNVAEAHFYT